MDNITEFQNHIRLVVQEPVKKKWQKMFLIVVTKVGPAGIVRPVHQIDNMGGTKQIHLRSYQMDDTFIYEVPLVRNLEESEAEAIIKMWSKMYDEGDFVIETSTPYREDDEVADDSDDLTTCCEKAKIKHNKWMHKKANEGYRYGIAYSEEEKTHPMLRPWDELPPQYRQIDESSMFGGMIQTKKKLREAMSSDEVLLGLKERDPEAIKFAQSINMPPAVITQYGELAAQEDSMPRKVKIAVLQAEDEIVDFIDAAIKKGAAKLSKGVSRRGFMTGVGNLASALSTLSQASKLMSALPKVEPKPANAPTQPSRLNWMNTDMILEILPYRVHEDYLNLFPGGAKGAKPKPGASVAQHNLNTSIVAGEGECRTFNNFLQARRIPWHAMDVANHESDEWGDELVWHMMRTKEEGQGQEHEIDLTLLDDDALIRRYVYFEKRIHVAQQKQKYLDDPKVYMNQRAQPTREAAKALKQNRIWNEYLELIVYELEKRGVNWEEMLPDEDSEEYIYGGMDPEPDPSFPGGTY